MLLGIRALGAITAVGANVRQTMGSLHAGVQLHDDLPGTAEDDEPVTVAATRIDARLSGVRRLVALGTFALEECAAGITPQRLPVLVCAPSNVPGSDVLKGLASSSAPIEARGSQVFANGRAGSVLALAAAEKLLHSKQAPGCFVLGMDCLFAKERLELLRSTGQLYSPSNPDGLIPGEAAAALLLTSNERQDPALVGFGAADDGPPGVEVTGRALGQAVDLALADARAPMESIGAVAHDGFGTRIAFEEIALATSRPPLAALRPVPISRITPCTGEVGAASGLLAIALLAFYAREGLLGQGPGLALMFSEGRGRAAAIVRPPK